MTVQTSIEELRESAKHIKAVFFDIDDTLRLKNEEYLPESAKEAFKRLKEKGIITGIASGRAYYGIVQEVLDLGADYYVTINGQYVSTPTHEEIYSNPIPPEIVEKLVKWTKQEDIQYVALGSNSVAISKWDTFGREALPIVYGDLHEDDQFYKKHPIYQMLTIADPDKTITLPDDLVQHVRLVKWHPNSDDIIPMNGSKANGIEQVLKKLNLTSENICVFGDELNDTEMFQYAGLSIAMGNANPKIKELADFVTKSVREDGILYALELLGII